MDLWRATDPKDERNRISYNTLILYWHECIQRINTRDIEKLCQALDCTVGELLEYAPDNDSK